MLLCLLLAAATAAAQPAYDTLRHRKAAVGLSLSSAAGLATMRDEGLSPLTNNGLSAAMRSTVEVALPRWRFSAATQIDGQLYGTRLSPTTTTYGLTAAATLKAMRRLSTTQQQEAPHCKHIDIYGGASADNIFIMHYNSQLQNASPSFSDFTRLHLHLRAEWWQRQRRSGVRWMYFAECSLSPVAMAIRPGYSYIDNYTAGASTTSQTFTTYQTNITALNSMATSLGVRLRLPHHTAVSAAYHWSYLTTANSGIYRLQQANHMLHVALYIPLN